MARKRAAGKGQKLQDSSAEALGAAQATAAGVEFAWHFGRVTSLGSYQAGDGRGVTIAWEEGGSTSHVGEFPDATWEVFKLAFTTAGRVAVLSDEEEGWWHDYRYVEALR
jgi:hypothetical protein